MTNDEKRLRREVFEWDIVNWSVAANFWEKRLTRPLNEARVLEIGACDGGLSLWFALKGANCVCADMRDHSRDAHEKHMRYGVAHKIQYEKLDARQIPYKERFDVVAFKSVLGGARGYFGDQAHIQIISEILKCLKPRGQVLFAENLAACRLHRLARKHFVKWGKFWKYLELAEVPALFADFAELDFMTCGFMGALGRRE